MLTPFQKIVKGTILENNQHIDKNVARILIRYKVEHHFIGDSLVRISYLKLIRSYFANAKISILYDHRIDKALLKENPYVDYFIEGDLDQINLLRFDLIIITGDEHTLMSHLEKKYEALFLQNRFFAGIYSLSPFLNKYGYVECMFPAYHHLGEYFKEPANYSQLKKEIFLKPEETIEAANWLTEKGIKEEENVFVLVDSSSSDEKLLDIETYFEMIAYFLKFPNAKILVFDEKKVDKSIFYLSWLGNSLANRFLFVDDVDFRQTLAILATPQVKLVFGPCTGVMHCASAIYNTATNTIKKEDIPVILVYSGTDSDENVHKSHWWSDKEPARCMIVKNTSQEPEIEFINPEIKEYLPCSAYKSSMLIEFIETRFQTQIRNLGIETPNTIIK